MFVTKTAPISIPHAPDKLTVHAGSGPWQHYAMSMSQCVHNLAMDHSLHAQEHVASLRGCTDRMCRAEGS